MNYYLLNVIFMTVLIFHLGICQRISYNQNTDFLLHEASGTSQHQQGNLHITSGKRDYVAPSTSPRSTSTSKQTTAKPATSLTGDNLHPNPQNSPSSSGKRDYVAPSTSPRTPHSSFQPTTAKLSGAPPKRDFVNPQFTTSSPLPHNTQNKGPGQVQGLVNFFNSNSNSGAVTPKAPSYSSILQGTTRQGSSSTAWGTSKIQQPVTQPTPNSPQGQTPLSYSSIVSGSNKQTTAKPSTRYSNITPSTVTSPTARPVTPRLPSAIVNDHNNNNRNQGGNANAPTDAELKTLSEELLRKDSNNAAKYVTVNFQEKTTSQSKEDKAPLPLMTVSPAAWNIPTVQKLIPLLDNYEKDTLVNEYVTPQERNEENTFMDAIMSTAVIRHLMTFLKDKGFVTPDPRQQRDFLKQLWFGLYSRGKGKISSSGFEHVFVSELKNGDVLGLHNWIFFAREEASNRVNYLGYLKYVQLNDKGVVMKLHFNQNGLDKPVNSMFIGTSPELEIALYTLCFITRADNDCDLKLGNKDVKIISHTFRYRSKNLIGSAYPQLV